MAEKSRTALKPLGALLVLAGAALVATPAEVKLSSRDQKLITQAACAVVDITEASQLTATRPVKGSSRIEVAVQCLPHRTEGQVPVARTVRCSSKAGTWQCADAQDVLLVKLRNSTLAVIPGAVPPGLAIELVTEAAQLTLPPFHKPATMLMQDSCTIAQPRPASFKGGMQYDLLCSGGSVFLTRDCWQQKCRHFITGSVEAAAGNSR